MKTRWSVFFVLLMAVLAAILVMMDSRHISAHKPNPADLRQIEHISGLLSDDVNAWQKPVIKVTVQKNPESTVLTLSHDLTFRFTRNPSITLFGQNNSEFAIALKTIRYILKKQGIEVFKGADIEGRNLREATLFLKLDARQSKVEWNGIWIRIFNEYTWFFYGIQAEPVLTITTFEGGVTH